MSGKCLYLGTDPSRFKTDKTVVHYPILDLKPRDYQLPEMKSAWMDFQMYTHILFTSKNAVRFFWEALQHFYPGDLLEDKTLVCIGKSTVSALEKAGVIAHRIADEETQEGMIEVLRLFELDKAYIFYPRSSLARKKIENFLIEQQIRHQVLPLYDMEVRKILPLPDLEEMDEIIFTSPSTIKAFVEVFQSVPKHIKISCIGPITEEALRGYRNFNFFLPIV